MKTKTLLALALSASAALAVPPASFGFPSSVNDTTLSITYGSQAVQPGILFGINVPAQAPTIAVNETYGPLNRNYTGQYLVFMVDPDASYPENPLSRWILHWWQLNLTRSTTDVNLTSIGGTRLVNTTAPQAAYRQPGPPTNSSAHRYIQYLFEQPSNFQIPSAYAGYGSLNRTQFPFVNFVNDAGLKSPVAANYFYCSNQTIVPPTFVAAPGGQYPGGNGAMVTQGTSNPSSTSSSSPSATSSGAVTTSSYAGGAGTVKANDAARGVILAVGAAWALV